MGVLATATGKDVREIIVEAAERQTPVVLSHRGAAGWRTFKSQFLPAGKEQSIHVGCPGQDTTGEAGLLAEGMLLGVSFRRGHRKCMFASVVDGRRALVTADGCVDALVLRQPEVIQMLQRRVYHRTPVPADRKIAVVIRCQTTGTDADAARRPSPSCRGLLRNISVGGMAVGVEPGTDLGLTIGQTVRAEVHLPTARALHVEVNYRHQTMVGNELQLGFQFVGLETTASGREAAERLSRLAVELQHCYR